MIAEWDRATGQFVAPSTPARLGGGGGGLPAPRRFMSWSLTDVQPVRRGDSDMTVYQAPHENAAEKLLRTMLCGFNRNGQAFAPLQACVRPRKAAERERADARETPSIRRVSTAAELDSEVGAPLEEDEWRER